MNSVNSVINSNPDKPLEPIIPVEEEPSPTVFSVARELLTTPKGIQKIVIEPSLKAIRWVEVCGEGLSETGEECKQLFKRTNLGIFWLYFPERIRKLKTSVIHLKNSLFSESIYEVTAKTNKVFIESIFTMGLFVDTIKAFHLEAYLHFTLSQLAVLSGIGFLGSIALFMNMISGLSEQMKNLLEAEYGAPKFKLSLLRVISKTTLAAVAFFGAVNFFIDSAIPTLFILTISTAFLLLSLTSHFYEKLYVETNAKKSLKYSP